ncbi:MAG: hypothetical protein OER88_08800 [Planctomycetota bacterium]|nr:hypothetical protein [Planctomycetota bacterium]
MHRFLARPLGLVLLVGLAGPAIAEVEQPEDPNPVVKMREDMETIADHLGNVKVRLKYVSARGGVSDLQTRGESRIQIPVTECCQVNLKEIERRTALILGTLRVLEADHRLKGDDEGRAAVVHSTETLRGFYASYRKLKGARQMAEADLMLQTTVREFNHFRRSLDEYESCCASVAATGDDDSSKKKRKKKRRKREGDAES